MDDAGSTHAGHPPLRRWEGPNPSDLHRLLLAACLESENATALAAWDEWLSRSDLDIEDPASVELAGLAVRRLGAAAGDCSVAVRSRGWNRRAWYMSELCLEVADKVLDVSRQRGVKVLALGDVATMWAGYRFSGRAFEVRRVEFRLLGNHRSEAAAFRQLPLSGSAEQAMRNGKVSLVIHPGGIRSATPRFHRASDGKLIPDTAAHIARLAAWNWRPAPPGRLRWIVEILAALETEPDAVALGRAIGAAAARDSVTWEVAAALRVVGSMPGGQAAARIAPVVEATPVPPLARSRRWAKGRYHALLR